MARICFVIKERVNNFLRDSQAAENQICKTLHHYVFNV